MDYEPVFNADVVSLASFQAGPHLGALIYPAAVSFRHGLGTFLIYMDRISEPILTVPINLAAFLSLDSGSAWVGFTASTGKSYQMHEMLSWSFVEGATEHSAFGGVHSAHLTKSQNAFI